FLFAQSLANIARVDLGIDVDSVLTFSIDPQASGYSPEASAQLLGRLRNELATLPGVTSVGNAAIALLGGGGLTTGAGVEGAEDGARVRQIGRASCRERVWDWTVAGAEELDETP